MVRGITFPAILIFDWDQGNLDHIQKHNVIATEAEEIFYNDVIYFPDTRHSSQEERFLAYGVTNDARLLTIIFTIRKSKVRIVSARDQHKKERAIYKQYTKM